jgi:hypothetical protein
MSQGRTFPNGVSSTKDATRARTLYSPIAHGFRHTNHMLTGLQTFVSNRSNAFLRGFRVVSFAGHFMGVFRELTCFLREIIQRPDFKIAPNLLICLSGLNIPSSNMSQQMENDLNPECQ